MNVQDVARRTHRYFYEDGLVEISVGGVFVVTGLFFLLLFLLPTSMTALIVFAVPILVFAGIYVTQQGVTRIKERLVYPRTGYVIYKDPDPTPMRWVVVAGALGLVAFAFLVPPNFSGLALVQAGLLGLVLVLIGWRVSLRRLYGVALVVLLLGGLVAWQNPNEILTSTLVFSGAGLALVASGFSGLLAYLRDNVEAADNDTLSG